VRQKTSVETTKLIRVHHLRWVPEIALLTFNFVHKMHARRPTVFDNLDLLPTAEQDPAQRFASCHVAGMRT